VLDVSVPEVRLRHAELRGLNASAMVRVVVSAYLDALEHGGTFR
jgi:hypothetical protein